MEGNLEPIHVVGATSRRLGWRVALPLLSLLAGAVAYRELAWFDPGAGRPRELEGAEALFFEPGSSSPWLVYAVAVWFLARRWSRLRESIGTSSRPLAASPLLLAGAVLCLWGHHTGTPSLQIPSLSLMLLGGALLMGGAAAFRALFAPALFLLLAVPIPTAIVNQIMYAMQLATARWAVWLLGLAGFDVLLQADLMVHADRTFQVIESCSGLRTVETLVMAAAVYQELLHRSRLHATLLVLASPALGLVTNLIRVCAIVLNPYSGLATVHTTQGLVMIVVGVLLLAAVDAILARLLPRSRSAPVTEDGRPERSPGRSQPRWLALASVIVVVAVGSLTIEPWRPRASPAPRLADVPGQLDEWSASRLRLDTQFLGSVSFSEWIHRRYQNDGEIVDLLVGGDDRLDAQRNLLSTKTAVLGSGWEIRERGRATLESGREVEAFRQRAKASDALVYRWHLGVDSTAREIARSLLALDRSGFRRSTPAIVVRISTPVRGGDLARAEVRLRTFGARVDAELSRIVGSAAGT